MKSVLFIYLILSTLCACAPSYSQNNITRLDIASIPYGTTSTVRKQPASLFSREVLPVHRVGVLRNDVLLNFEILDSLLTSALKSDVAKVLFPHVDARLTVLVSREGGQVDILSFGGPWMSINGSIYNLSSDLLLTLSPVLPLSQQDAIREYLAYLNE